MKKKLSLFHYFHIISLVMFVTFTAIFLAITTYNARSSFEKETLIFKTTYLDAKKKILQNEVERFVDFIEFKQSEGYLNAQKIVQSRVNEAHEIASSLYKKYQHTHSPDQIKSMILNTLKIIHFENNSG